MKRFFLAAMLAAATVPALATDVGVSVSIGQPGFYGRIDIGSFPGPQVLYDEPIIIESAPVAVVRRPVYLHVPPGHAKNWAKHCHRYSACGQPVFFVQPRWYEEVYVPHYRRVDSGRDRPRYTPERAENRRDDRRDDWSGGGRRDDRRHDRSDKGRGGKHGGGGKGNGNGRD